MYKQTLQCQAANDPYWTSVKRMDQAIGRDAMCWEVLNDDWASFPTTASEEVVENPQHRKNTYEEALFKCEEDRHELDIEIETNMSTIRLLTSIVNQVESMTPEERDRLQLPYGLGGYSEALPRRALKKVYDPQRALEIMEALHTHPAVVAPIVLRRLQQKDEEWRRQRRG
ncbi:Transcriptional regulatory protein SIN3, partial [Zancudomyces culisetae]